MLKKVLFAVVATGFVTALALPVQFTAAEAATTCKDAAKMDFPNDRKSAESLQEGVQGRLESLAARLEAAALSCSSCRAELCCGCYLVGADPVGLP